MTERSPRIAIVGTFDLENYGDLLFPILAERELRRRFGDVDLRPFSYHAKSPPQWPYAVDSVVRLPELVQDLDGLLIGGGFLIRFDKDVAPGYGPPTEHIHHPTGNWLTPGLMAQQHGVPVALNAPGLHVNEIPAWAVPLLRQLLVGSGYVSVRDEPSAAALAEVAPVDISVVPDTAFGLERLLAEEPGAATIRPEGPYVVVQAAVSEQPFCQWWADHAAALGEWQPVLLPVSPVLGERTDPLNAVVPDAIAAPWSDPLTIARLVAGAEAVIGHSYHLAITALCAGVPVFTPADLSVGKFSALEGLDAVYPAPQGDDDPATFLDRLGRTEVQPEVERRVNQLDAHWDRIAEALRAGAVTVPALNRMWQALPTWLETAAPPPPVPAADTNGEVAWLHGEVQAQRARTHEVERLLRLARSELAAREPKRRTPRLPPRLRRGVLELRPLRIGKLETDPYRWAMIDALFTPAAAAELAETYPHDRFKRIESRGGEKDYAYHGRSLIGMGGTSPEHPERLSGAWRKLAGDLLAPGYREAMSLLIERDLSDALLEVNVMHYGPGSELGPHKDLPEKLVTHVLYFNRTWAEQDGGCLSILRSRDPADVVTRILPVVGNSAVIVRSDDSWHAVDPVVADSRLSRRSVTVTFHQPGSVSSMWVPGDQSPLIEYHGGDGTG